MKKTWGVYVVEFFAVLMMLIGTALMVLEGLAHYRPYFTHKAAGTVIVSNWTATPFIVGGVLIVFGSLILAYALVKPVMDEMEDGSTFVSQLLQSVKLWGNRSTDKTATAAVVAAAVVDKPVASDPNERDKP
jgi:hypothetical protein